MLFKVNTIFSKIFWEIASPFITAAATIALVYTGINQSRWVKTTLKYTQTSNAQVNRAYVCLDHIEIDTNDMQLGLKINCSWRNNGATPTMKFAARINYELVPIQKSPENLLSNMPFEFNTTSSFALSRDKLYQSKLIIKNIINSINNGTHILLVWYECRYYDIFDSSIIRTTRVINGFKHIDKNKLETYTVNQYDLYD